MQKRVIFLLVLILAAVVPASAQESDCDINLEQALTLLFQAQRQADSDNAFGAVQTIGDVQADLQVLIDTCSGLMFPMPMSFVAPDESLAFNYPENWTMRTMEDGVYMVSSTPAMDDMEYIDVDHMPSGEQMLMVAVMDIAEMYQNQQMGSFDEVISMMRQDLIDANEQVSQPVPMEFKGRQAMRFHVETTSASAIIDVVDYMSDDQKTVLIMMGFAGQGETAALEPVFEAFEASVRHPAVLSLRQLGVPMKDLTYVSAAAITDLNEDIKTRVMALAPDGSAIAWWEESAICLYTFDDQMVTCDPIPEDYRSRPPMLHWSPDSAYIAFSADFFQFFHEPDIYIYVVTERRVFDRTDDGFREWNLISPDDEEGPGPVWIDAVFTWGPDGYIYFIRDTFPSSTSDRDEMWTGLFRMAPEGGEPELIRDLTGVFSLFPIYPTADYSLEGVMAVSPDAQRIALLIRENEFDSPRNGVWVMDLSGANPPAQIVTSDIFSTGLPESYRDQTAYGTIPYALTWDAEGTGFYLLARDYGNREMVSGLAYHIDVQSGRTTLLTDVTDFTAEEFMAIDEATGRSPQFLMAQAAVLAPDGSGLLIFNRDPISGVMGISSLRVVDGTVENELLYLIEDAEVLPSMSATVARDGTALMWGYLFMPGK